MKKRTAGLLSAAIVVAGGGVAAGMVAIAHDGESSRQTTEALYAELQHVAPNLYGPQGDTYTEFAEGLPQLCALVNAGARDTARDLYQLVALAGFSPTEIDAAFTLTADWCESNADR